MNGDYRNAILCGDALDTLRRLPSGIVQTCISSPPYWGLRDYGVDGQIGLEESLDEWCARLVAVFREVKRVSQDDATLWVNIGDRYATDGRKGRSEMGIGKNSAYNTWRNRETVAGVKPKDLIGLPWMLAFALRADGWYLRSDIVWAKSNPMPESVRDRPTKAHEYLFLLSKSPRYLYDADAICEPVTGGAHPRVAARHSRIYVDRDPAHIYGRSQLAIPAGWDTSRGQGGHGSIHRDGRRKPGVTPKNAPAGQGIKANESFHAATTQLVESRNKRSVWTLATAPFPQAHFATFPPKLIEPCILAGSRPGDLVLDPFGGSGTVGLVAHQHGRDYLLIDLNPAYCEMARERIHGKLPTTDDQEEATA